MQKYVALLRGINVGGNNIIKMLDLKASFENMGFENVATLIQSGNVIFASDEKDLQELEKKIERALDKRFNYTSKVLVRSYPQVQKVLKDVPHDWKKREDIRKYIAFLKLPLTASQAIKEIEIREDVDWVKAGDDVVYLTSLLGQLTKSKINKIAAKKIYKDMSIRNYNTSLKIAKLME